MKILYSFLCLLLFSFSGIAQVSLPITFEDDNIDYDLTPFEGADDSDANIVTDPTDPNNKVAEFVKDLDAGGSAGVTIGETGLLSAINFDAANTSMTVRVWSPDAGIPVRLKVENANDPAQSVETEVNTTAAMDWETLTFDFSNEAVGTAQINFAFTYNKVSIFFNFGTDGATAGVKTYYFDDIIFGGGPSLNQIDLPVTFEDPTIDYSLIDFGDAISTIITDPTNAANTVIQTEKNATAGPFAGTVIGGNNGFANAIPFTATDQKMTVRIWSPEAGIPVMLKVENAVNGGISVESGVVNTTLAMAWETMEFDFGNPNAGSLDLSQTYEKAVIFFNFAIAGTNPGLTFYWDDVIFLEDAMDQVDLPITFENIEPDYYSVFDFNGNTSTIITDPTDPSNKVMQSVRGAMAMTSAGTAIGQNGLANPIPFTETDKKISVRVWSPEVGGIIRLKVENSANGGIFAEVDKISSIANDWETIEFDFNDLVGGSIDLANEYDKVVVFFNFGQEGSVIGEQTYYWDDVMFVFPPMLTQINLPVTFEDAATVDYNLADFAGNTSAIIIDPTDPANTVVETVRGTDALTFAGTIIGDNGFANAIPFTETDQRMTVRVWSPAAGIPVMLKVENVADGGINVESGIVNTTVAMDWETIEFDFGNPNAGSLDLSQTYEKAVIFFYFTVSGADAGEATFYWDDVLFLSSPPPTEPDLPLTFESTTIDYNLFDFNGNVSTIITDPTDPNNTVVESIRLDNADIFAGTVAGGAGLVNPVPFTENDKTMSARVWSPEAGVVIRLKVENAADNTILAEVDMMTTVAMQWETLTFDFNDPVNGSIDLANVYDKVVIFFNFGLTGADAGEQTYYWDDIMFVPTVLNQVDLPITFEDSSIDYDLSPFEGADDSDANIITDPTDPNNKVTEFVKDLNAGGSAGVTIGESGLLNAINFDAANTSMTVRVWSPDAGIPVRLKVENANDPTQSVETEVNTTTAMAWETLTFDFSNQATGTAEINFAFTYDKVSIFFNFGTDGATAGVKTYYFDDIMFGGGPSLNQIDLPVTFEETTVDYTLIDFNGTTSTIVVDPTNSVNTVVETVRGVDAATFAGTVIGTDNGFANVIPFTAGEQKMTASVWSPAAGLPVMMKVENVMDGGISVESGITNTTVAMAWETLEFDFGNPNAGVLDLSQTYGKAVIFFNFGVSGADAGEMTFYWDDVMFSGIELNVENVANANIKISPNPANEFINIIFPEAISTATVATLINVNGKVMLQNDLTSQVSQINTSALSAGTYFLRIDTSTDSYYQKVMIVR